MSPVNAHDVGPTHGHLLPTPTIVLCADDYGMSAGINKAIEQLAHTGRLSATSALVTLPNWPEHGGQLKGLADRIAIGLHINLTLGAPLGPMPRLAPDGALPTLRSLLASALSGRIGSAEIEAEVTRQIERFERVVGAPPDHVDGHQHVHAVPGVRSAVLAALSRRYSRVKPLVRDPFDRPAAILGRGGAMMKALILAGLSVGFGAAARRVGFATNRGFAGVSRFNDRTPYGDELNRFFRFPGPLHLIMCHPGYVDDELRRRDPLVDRRRAELDAIRRAPHLPALIWRAVRAGPGRPVDWPVVEAARG